MRGDITFTSVVERFPGQGGWYYLAVPDRYTKTLAQKRAAWGMFPITAQVGDVTWQTKLMTKRGGTFFVALKASVRARAGIALGDRVTVAIKVM